MRNPKSGYGKYVIGGWLQVYANSTDKPHVSYTPLFQQDAVSNAEESSLRY
jgi:hypothetical protein